jgi:CheY-like chemotaxis protein
METIRRLKSDPGTAGIPVVMVTASGDEEMARAAVAAGAFAYVVKPWDNNQIEETVEAALRDRARA